MNRFIQDLNWALTNPVNTLYQIGSRCAPELLYRRYATLTRQAGIDEVYLILSFDCDTEDDISVAWEVHSRLQDMGVNPVYAVPGDLLRRGEKVYSRIHESGSAFINHGDIEHTYFDTDKGRHASCFFYDEQPYERLRKDIADAHKTLQDVLGVTACGFRTPHFGTFQRPEHLEFLYKVLRDLNYVFSTSTLPVKGFHNGGLYDVDGIKELPVTGTASRPLQILDTWGYFEAPDRKHVDDDYYYESIKLADKFSAYGAGIINIYADPSHVHGKEPFYQAIKKFIDIASPVTYEEIPGLM